MRALRVPILWLAISCLACVSAPPPAPQENDGTIECRSLQGEALRPPALPKELAAERQAALDEARAASLADGQDADARVMYGRRLGYLGLYRAALQVFEQGALDFPEDPRFPRHAGHRQISLRRFADAQRTLEHSRALAGERRDEPEPALKPNATGIDLDWLQHSILYHLGLARFCQDDWAGAVDAFRSCFDISRNDDARVSAGSWLVLSLRRLGRDAEAQEVLASLSGELSIVEYRGYADLIRYYQGRLSEEELLAEARSTGGIELGTRGLGAALWNKFEGRDAAYRALIDEILADEQWAAFGHIVAEVEFARRAAR
jgi:tetratricopeptide (TPR) repeat protein